MLNRFNYLLLETGTGILNRRHFDFSHEDAPCFKFDILTLNFPPLLGENAKRTSHHQNSNLGPANCGLSMLPRDQRAP